MRRTLPFMAVLTALLLGVALGWRIRAERVPPPPPCAHSITVNCPDEKGGRRTHRLEVWRAVGPGVRTDRGVRTDERGELILGSGDWMVAVGGTTYVASPEPLPAP